MSTGAKANPFLVFMSDQTRVSNKDNKSYSNVASERWYQNHDKIKLNNNIKITSNSKVSAPHLPTFYHIKYELSIAGIV